MEKKKEEEEIYNGGGEDGEGDEPEMEEKNSTRSREEEYLYNEWKENETLKKRVDNTLKRIKLAQLKEWECFICKKTIKTLEPHFHCFDCCEESVDLCMKCEKTQKKSAKKHYEQKHRGHNFFYPVTQPQWMLSKYLREGLKDRSSYRIMLECFGWYQKRDFLGFRSNVNHEFTWVTYERFQINVKNLARGMKSQLGLNFGDFCAVCCNIRIEFPLLFFACFYLGVVIVPVQTILSVEEKQSILEQISDKCTCVFLLDKFIDQFKELEGVLSKKCKYVLISDEYENLQELKEEYELYNEVVAIGERENKYFSLNPIRNFSTSNILFLIFTSGTTGRPKGVVFREKSFFGKLTGYHSTFPLAQICYQPFSHNSGLYLLFSSFFNGGRVALLTNGDMNNFFEDMKEIRPTFFSCVPRILNHVFDEYNCLIKDSTKDDVVDKLKNVFGGRLGKIVVGSAFSSFEVRKFIRELFLIPCMNAYGATESGTTLFNNRKSKNSELKMIDCPELGYFVSSDPPVGELCVKNEITLELEYYKDETTSKLKLDEQGYFHTGDIVKKIGSRYIVIDRIKNIIKLSQGEFVSIEKVESILEDCKCIKQIILIPNPSKTYLVSLVLPITDKFTKENVMEAIKEMQKISQLKPWEIPKKFHLVETPFKTTESRKKNRREIMKQYKEVINELFQKDFEDIFKSVLSEYDETKSFLSSGFDSLTGTKLIGSLKARGISLDFKSLMNEKQSLKEVINNIKISHIGSTLEEEGKINKGRMISFEREKRRMEDLVEEINFVDIEEIKIRGIFLTGSTGFVGSFILRELCKHFPDAKVYCLVRKNPKNESDNVIFIKGDLSIEFFGIKKEEFEDLSKKIDICVHCGAMVNHFLPYSDHFDANVGSLFTLVKLLKGKPIVLISSNSVFSGRKDFSIEKQMHFANSGYSGSKFVCDFLTTKYYKNSIVFRLPLIVASNSCGEINKKDWFYRIVSAIRKYQICPNDNIDSALNVIPVDITSEIVVRTMKMILEGKKVGGKREFNLFCKNVSFKEYVEMVEKCEKVEFKRMEFGEWIKEISKLVVEDHHTLEPFLRRLKSRQRIGSVGFCRYGFKMKRFLKDIGMKVERINVDDVEKCVKFMNII